MAFEDGKPLEGNFYFDPDDPVYLDHFPGNPVVPGSLVIEGFIEAVLQADARASVKGIENFKFRRFLPPGSYRYEMQRRGSKMYCRLYGPEAVVLSTGTLIL